MARGYWLNRVGGLAYGDQSPESIKSAIDTYVEQMSTRTLSANASMKAANVNPAVRDRLGHAVGLMRSSRARLMQVMAESGEYAYRRPKCLGASRRRNRALGLENHRQ